MGQNVEMYKGLVSTTKGTIAFSPASGSTRITYAEVCNDADEVAVLDVWFDDTPIIKHLALRPNETRTLGPLLGGLLPPLGPVKMQASIADAIQLKLDGYEIDTPT